MKLAVDGRHLAEYIYHTSHGRSLRDLARASGKFPSTLSRRVARIEALRDCQEWDAILDAIAKRFPTPRHEITRDMVLDAIGVTLAAIRLELRRVAPQITAPGGMIVAARDFQRAVVTAGAENDIANLDMDILRGALALGLVEPINCDNLAGRSELRKYRAATPSGNAISVQLGSGLLELVRGAARRGFKPLSGKHAIDAAMAVEYMFALGRTDGLSTALPPVALDCLRYGVEGRGFESMEKDFGWPARSAKVATAIALELAARHLEGGEA